MAWRHQASLARVARKKSRRYERLTAFKPTSWVLTSLRSVQAKSDFLLRKSIRWNGGYIPQCFHPAMSAE
jgi:hypothetical protein